MDQRNQKEKSQKEKSQKEHSKRNRQIGTVIILIIAVFLGTAIYTYGLPLIQSKFQGKNNNVQTLNNAKKTGHSKSTDIAADTEELAEKSTEIEQITEKEYDSDKNITETADTINTNETEPYNRKPRVKVKGIYVSAPRAGMNQYMDDLIHLVDTTELNTMVIDIKNDSGEITYDMDLLTADKINAKVKYIRDMNQLVKRLKKKNIYLIARIVAFKDPILAEHREDLSLKNKDGSIFRDKAGLAWVNPYKTEVWDYLVDVGRQAAEIGFDEIQFDYIRFSTDNGMKNVVFGEEAKERTKEDTITEFTRYACDTLKPLGVYVSADVYGTIIDSVTDARIVGQNYVEMSKYLDYISPMVYPSHYVEGAYGIQYPDKEPYRLILKTMDASKETLSVIQDNENKAVVRPWLQDFTASWLAHYKRYGGNEIREQIKAVNDAGYEEWILWNGSNNYTKKGLRKQ